MSGPHRPQVAELPEHQVHRAEAMSVRASRTELRVRARAEATLRLAIDKAPSLPRPPAQTPPAPKGKTPD